MKETQQSRVAGRLREVGYISRNQCLQNYISRLSSIILSLKDKGWEFTTKEENGDYIYTLVSEPNPPLKTSYSPLQEEIRHTQELSKLQPSLSI